MKPIKLILLMALISAGKVLALGPEEIPETVKSQFETVKERLAVYAGKHGYKKDFLNGTPKIYLSSNVYYQTNTYQFRTTHYRMELSPEGNLISFINDYASSRGDEAIYDRPTEPAWTPEKAVEVATEYAQAILGSLPKDLGKPRARYDHQLGSLYDPTGKKPKKYWSGKWMVNWPRVDEKSGYPYETDEWMVVNVYETEGPSVLNVNLTSSFAGVDFVPLKKEEIMPEAMKRAQQFQLAGKGTFDGGRLFPGQADLKIVQPNYFEKLAEIPAKRDLHARLAWVVWFAWVMDGDPHPNPDNPRRGFSIWIDAQNGKWLGGDAFAK